MKKVTLTFVGEGSDRIAEKFYSWMTDGGLEDSMIENLSDREISVVGISDMDNETRDVVINTEMN
ncbi:hypothetical protein [Vibrio jasicida]|uniref:Uncharacterized protein n=1 Tax=Vibrio jasicida TaxID=766224 RepID=A0AAU9QJ07_9VIBR|nr:hypothetical protein [Vibrio jasicida]CAH1570508.1 conserved hypothetical protein [Vibrio jasicida]CAH1580145.1 conserved hypothetical protein [Vibrio jasicida]